MRNTRLYQILYNKINQAVHWIQNILKWVIIQKLPHLVQILDTSIKFIANKEGSNRNEVMQNARGPIIFGCTVIFFFVFIGGIWSILAPLDSASYAIGTVVTVSNKKIIQHPTGGIIKSINVNQGDTVNEGQLLLELDAVDIRSKYDSALNQYRTFLSVEDRLIAERDNLDQINFNQDLLSNINHPDVAKIINTQENLFRSKKDVFRSEQESFKQRIAQYNKQIEGYNAKISAEKKALKSIEGKLNSAKKLFEKGFIQQASLLDIDAKYAAVKSEMAITESEIAKMHHEITKCEIDIMNLQNKNFAQTFHELTEIHPKVSSLKESVNTLADALNRVKILSPVHGIINVVKYHTIGGVISPGSAIIEISPINDELVIEAKVSARDIDSIHVGLNAKIRFSAFKSRTTPVFTGTVISLSPDIQEQNPYAMQEPHYIARIQIDMVEFNKIAKQKKLKLLPGMQAEVQIIRGTRTLFQYLLDPLTDTMFKAFKEK